MSATSHHLRRNSHSLPLPSLQLPLSPYLPLRSSNPLLLDRRYLPLQPTSHSLNSGRTLCATSCSRIANIPPLPTLLHPPAAHTDRPHLELWPTLLSGALISLPRSSMLSPALGIHPLGRRGTRRSDHTLVRATAVQLVRNRVILVQHHLWIRRRTIYLRVLC